MFKTETFQTDANRIAHIKQMGAGEFFCHVVETDEDGNSYGIASSERWGRQNAIEWASCYTHNMQISA